LSGTVRFWRSLCERDAAAAAALLEVPAADLRGADGEDCGSSGFASTQSLPLPPPGAPWRTYAAAGEVAPSAPALRAVLYRRWFHRPFAGNGATGCDDGTKQGAPNGTFSPFWERRSDDAAAAAAALEITLPKAPSDTEEDEEGVTRRKARGAALWRDLCADESDGDEPPPQLLPPSPLGDGSGGDAAAAAAARLQPLALRAGQAAASLLLRGRVMRLEARARRGSLAAAMAVGRAEDLGADAADAAARAALLPPPSAASRVPPPAASASRLPRPPGAAAPISHRPHRQPAESGGGAVSAQGGAAAGWPFDPLPSDDEAPSLSNASGAAQERRRERAMRRRQAHGGRHRELVRARCGVDRLYVLGASPDSQRGAMPAWADAADVEAGTARAQHPASAGKHVSWVVMPDERAPQVGLAPSDDPLLFGHAPDRFHAADVADASSRGDDGQQQSPLSSMALPLDLPQSATTSVPTNAAPGQTLPVLPSWLRPAGARTADVAATSATLYRPDLSAALLHRMPDAALAALRRLAIDDVVAAAKLLLTEGMLPPRVLRELARHCAAWRRAVDAGDPPPVTLRAALEATHPASAAVVAARWMRLRFDRRLPHTKRARAAAELRSGEGGALLWDVSPDGGALVPLPHALFGVAEAASAAAGEAPPTGEADALRLAGTAALEKAFMAERVPPGAAAAAEAAAAGAEAARGMRVRSLVITCEALCDRRTQLTAPAAALHAAARSALMALAAFDAAHDATQSGSNGSGRDAHASAPSAAAVTALRRSELALVLATGELDALVCQLQLGPLQDAACEARLAVVEMQSLERRARSGPDTSSSAPSPRLQLIAAKARSDELEDARDLLEKRLASVKLLTQRTRDLPAMAPGAEAAIAAGAGAPARRSEKRDRALAALARAGGEAELIDAALEAAHEAGIVALDRLVACAGCDTAARLVPRALAAMRRRVEAAATKAAAAAAEVASAALLAQLDSEAAAAAAEKAKEAGKRDKEREKKAEKKRAAAAEKAAAAAEAEKAKDEAKRAAEAARARAAADAAEAAAEADARAAAVRAAAEAEAEEAAAERAAARAAGNGHGSNGVSNGHAAGSAAGVEDFTPVGKARKAKGAAKASPPPERSPAPAAAPAAAIAQERGPAPPVAATPPRKPAAPPAKPTPPAKPAPPALPAAAAAAPVVAAVPLAVPAPAEVPKKAPPVKTAAPPAPAPPQPATETLLPAPPPLTPLSQEPPFGAGPAPAMAPAPLAVPATAPPPLLFGSFDPAGADLPPVATPAPPPPAPPAPYEAPPGAHPPSPHHPHAMAMTPQMAAMPMAAMPLGAIPAMQGWHGAPNPSTPMYVMAPMHVPGYATPQWVPVALPIGAVAGAMGAAMSNMAGMAMPMQMQQPQHMQMAPPVSEIVPQAQLSPLAAPWPGPASPPPAAPAPVTVVPEVAVAPPAEVAPAPPAPPAPPAAPAPPALPAAPAPPQPPAPPALPAAPAAPVSFAAAAAARPSAAARAALPPAAPPSSHGLMNEYGDLSCFLNSVVQGMWHLRSFRDALASASAPASREPTPAEAAAGRGSDAARDAAVCLALRQLFDTLSSAAAAAPGGAPPAPASAAALRSALGALAPDASGVGEMGDAAETLTLLLDALHAAEAGRGAEAEADAAVSLARSHFGWRVTEGAACSACGREARGVQYTALQLAAPAAALVAARAALGPGMPAEAALRSALAPGTRTCATEDGGCGCTDAPGRLWLRPPADGVGADLPPVLALTLGWESAAAAPSDVAATLDALSPSLKPARLFGSGSAPPAGGADPRYALRAMLCFHGAHYAAFTRAANDAAWRLVNDAAVRPAGAWADVRKMCARQQLQPCVCFYERDA
jgi:hypothetical protein